MSGLGLLLIAAVFGLGAGPPVGGLQPGASPRGMHPNSLSSSYLRVDGDAIHHRLRCQVLSVLEVLPDLDGDLDGRLTEAELSRGSADLLEYLGEHYRLDPGEGIPLRPSWVHLAPSPGSDDPLDPFRDMDWIDCDLLWRAAAPIEQLDLRVTLFRSTSPDHIDICTVEGLRGDAQVFLMDPELAQARWTPASPGGGAGTISFFVLGWWHILLGWDHLAFLGALLLSARGFKPLLWVVTAFTLAHSITLALVVLDVVQVARFSHHIESLIALSIAYVACDILLHLDRLRSRAVESLLFGLVHGLGFAGFLQESLLAESSRVPALLFFNLGVEAGQIVVVATVALLLGSGNRRGPGKGAPGLAPRRLRLLGSISLALLGIALFASRVR